MRFIEKEAYAWVHQEILTLDQAEEYIRRQRERRDAYRQESEAGARHPRRALTPTEQRFISAWLDMGFDEDAIELAYDRTVTNTGALKWGYMNKILQSWHEKSCTRRRRSNPAIRAVPHRRQSPPRRANDRHGRASVCTGKDMIIPIFL